MAGAKAKPVTVEESIAAFPADVRAGLAKIRQTIRKAAPKAEEVISYGIPAYRLNGMLIFFSAYKSHYSLAFPPVSAAFEVFKKPLSKYSVSKSTIQFPFDGPLPLPLIRDIAELRVKENMAKATVKTVAKKSAKKAKRK